jgi:hypothetical protein
VSRVAVYFLLVGVRPDHQQADLRRAVQALRKEKFVANTASADSILAQADRIRAGKTDPDNHGKAVTE